MMKTSALTQSSTKRIVAAALAGLKADRSWSNADLGDVLGCNEGTARNRMADEEPNNQMPVHELRRLIAAGEIGTVDKILHDLGVHIERDDFETPADALKAAACSNRTAAALIEAAPDGISKAEWRVLLPLLEAEDAMRSALLVEGRRALAGER